jgi:hypothetical protein
LAERNFGRSSPFTENSPGTIPTQDGGFFYEAQGVSRGTLFSPPSQEFSR